MKRVALGIGMACWGLGIQLLLLYSKVILRLCLKNNNVHAHLAPKQAVPFFSAQAFAPGKVVG